MSAKFIADAQIYDLGNHAPCDPTLPAKAIPHITWDKNGTKSKPIPLVSFNSLVSYFRHNPEIAPHILWDPFTGRIAQFYPADSRSFSLVDKAGGPRTNRAGKVVIQIEALFFPYCEVNGKAYATLRDTPCKNWGKIQDWCSSWGVPKKWPGGKPNGFTRDTMGVKEYQNASGYIGHFQVPENTHTDPGYWPDFVDTTPKPNAVHVPGFPGASYFHLGSKNSYVTMADKELVRLHFTKHNDGNGYQPGPVYTKFTRDNVRDFQIHVGWHGSDADGFIGPVTWHSLFTEK